MYNDTTDVVSLKPEGNRALLLQNLQLLLITVNILFDIYCINKFSINFLNGQNEYSVCDM